MKLKWRVAPVPTGRYRSFEFRGWPTATYADSDEWTAVTIDCEDEYVPANARAGSHGPLTIRLAQWYSPEERGSRAAFEWRTVVDRASTLQEAKEVAQKILNDRPDFWPEGVK